MKPWILFCLAATGVGATAARAANYSVTCTGKFSFSYQTTDGDWIEDEGNATGYGVGDTYTEAYNDAYDAYWNYVNTDCNAWGANSCIGDEPYCAESSPRP